jgi:hypothetical protein
MIYSVLYLAKTLLKREKMEKELFHFLTDFLVLQRWKAVEKIGKTGLVHRLLHLYSGLNFGENEI